MGINESTEGTNIIKSDVEFLLDKYERRLLEVQAFIAWNKGEEDTLRSAIDDLKRVLGKK